MTTLAIPELAAGELPSTWKEAGRGWGHPLHKLAPYVGCFPAQLARWFVLNLSDPGDVVLDPFCGGGTTLLESLLCDRDAVGSDAFEYAYVLSHAKARPLAQAELEAYLDDRVAAAATLPDPEPPDPDLRVFFAESTLDQLLRLRTVLEDDESDAALFLKAAVAGVLHGPSRMFLSAPQKDQTSSTVGYVRRYLERHGIEPPERDVRESVLAKARRSRLDALPERRGRLSRADSRALDVADASVDLVVTSPPYMAVLDYSWNNWLRLWWLGRERAEERSKLLLSRREALYREFMRASLAEMHRVLRDGSAAVIVVGDVRKGSGERARTINSALLIAEEALAVGFEVDRVIDDVYRLGGRSMLVLNSLKWGYGDDGHAARSSVPIDRCLVLRKGALSWRDVPIEWAAAV